MFSPFLIVETGKFGSTQKSKKPETMVGYRNVHNGSSFVFLIPNEHEESERRCLCTVLIHCSGGEEASCRWRRLLVSE